MLSDTTHFDRFVRAVHRRMIVVRLLERVGLCVLIASFAALMLFPILIWRGESGLVFAAAILGGAIVAGLVWGLLQRPSVARSTAEADRQLELHDLLGSALAVQRGKAQSPNAESWAQAVVAMADHRCRTLSPASVIANRFAARAWGGIGLTAALVLTLAMIPANPASTRAQGPIESAPMTRATPLEETSKQAPAANAGRPVDRSTPRFYEPSEESNRSRFNSASVDAGTARPNDKNRSGDSIASGDGAGDGKSETRSSSRADEQASPDATGANENDPRARHLPADHRKTAPCRATTSAQENQSARRNRTRAPRSGNLPHGRRRATRRCNSRANAVSPQIIKIVTDYFSRESR